MGTYRGERNYRKSDVFREAYLQCNYPYKVFSRAALRGLSLPETVAAAQAITFDSVPKYWQDRFHGSDDNRDTGWLYLDIALTLTTIIDIVDLGYGAGLLLMSRIALKTAERAAAREALAMRHFAAAAMDERLVMEGAHTFEGFKRAYIKYVGPQQSFPPAQLGKTTPDGFKYTVLGDGNVYMVPRYLQESTAVTSIAPDLDTGYAKLKVSGYLKRKPTEKVWEEHLLNIEDNPFYFFRRSPRRASTGCFTFRAFTPPRCRRGKAPRHRGTSSRCPYWIRGVRSGRG